MRDGYRRVVVMAFSLVLAACSAGPEASGPNLSNPTPTVQDVEGIEYFAPLEPGTYSIDPDVDRSTPLRVVYEIPADGWERWIGAAKFSDAGHVGVSITTVTNLVRHGCRDHSWADPPVGPSVNDLAAALADLAPFRVTSPPKDVTIYGYSGKHLELTVPDLPVEGEGDDRRFTGCVGGNLKSWVAAIDTEPGDAYYGYTGPGYTEEFWILDVDGTRLMIVAERSPGSPRKDLAEQRAILDSIRIEP
jgi:hypothetical protein